jgi:tetratricopeptide (TPR) repeat protein
MQKIVLSNRAQSYLKLKRYQEAEADADAALSLDPEHIKSLQRRGTARYYLGKLRGASKDFDKAQQLQFSQQIAEYQKKVAEKLEKLKFEMIEKMKRRGQSLLSDETSASIELVKVTVTELNPPAPLPG